MRSLSNLSSLLLLILLLTACGKDGDNPSPDTATFRIDFSQTGDYEKFVRIFTITGGEFKYRGTNDKMPTVMSGDNINKPTWSVEAQDVRELEISALTTFSPVESGPASMTMKFTIYKDGVLLDEKSFTYNQATKDRTELLSYKAN